MLHIFPFVYFLIASVDFSLKSQEQKMRHGKFSHSCALLYLKNYALTNDETGSISYHVKYVF